MSTKATVISEIERIRNGSGDRLPPLTEETPLIESGLDSLGLAILVTRLEDMLGKDPFTESEVGSPPVTVGDFIRVYDSAA